MTPNMRIVRPNSRILKLALRRAALSAVLVLGACSGTDKPNFEKQDRTAGLDRQDYRDALKPRAPETDGSMPPIP